MAKFNSKSPNEGIDPIGWCLRFILNSDIYENFRPPSVFKIPKWILGHL